MTAASLRPHEHYAEAERLLAALPSHGLTTEQLLTVESARALTHAVLATVAPRTLRGRHSRRGNRT